MLLLLLLLLLHAVLNMVRCLKPRLLLVMLVHQMLLLLAHLVSVVLDANLLGIVIFAIVVLLFTCVVQLMRDLRDVQSRKHVVVVLLIDGQKGVGIGH